MNTLGYVSHDCIFHSIVDKAAKSPLGVHDTVISSREDGLLANTVIE